MERMIVMVVAALVASAPTPAAGAGIAAVEVARDLESIPSAAAPAAVRAEARRRLLSWMRAAGLERLEPGAAGRASAEQGSGNGESLTGVLPGAASADAGREVILVVTVGRPGEIAWPADARAAAVALAAISELARIPRRHSIRVLLLERAGDARSSAERWTAALSSERRDSLLAVIDLDGIGGAGGGAGRGVVRLTPVEGSAPASLHLTPGWLVHAALAGGRAVGEPLAVAAPRFSPGAQLLARSTAPPGSAAAEAFLAAGIPAVSLGATGLWTASRGRGERAGLDAVGARLSAWTRRLTATVRRLDTLDGRPRADGEYVGLVGRIWSRRDLYWVGLVVWILLVVGGLPGRWRGRASDERAVLGRRYLPGFAARGLLLVTLLALPVLGFFLLLPAAVVWIAACWVRLPRRSAVALAVLPWAVWSAGVAWLLVTGRAESLALGLPALALLGATLAAILWSLTHSEERPG